MASFHACKCTVEVETPGNQRLLIHLQGSQPALTLASPLSFPLILLYFWYIYICHRQAVMLLFTLYCLYVWGEQVCVVCLDCHVGSMCHTSIAIHSFIRHWGKLARSQAASLVSTCSSFRHIYVIHILGMHFHTPFQTSVSTLWRVQTLCSGSACT